MENEAKTYILLLNFGSFVLIRTIEFFMWEPEAYGNSLTGTY